jgi:hypothetical protein
MIDKLHQLKQSQSWEEVRLEFGKYLGLEEAAPAGVTRRAMEDRMFAHYLVVCREHPSYLEKLLKDPKNKKYEDTAAGAGVPVVPAAVERSNLELVAKASKSLLKWAKAGFERVDQVEYDKRFEACKNCLFLAAAPDKIVYKFKLKNETDMRVCNACGCVASRKARLATEACPKADPANPGFNRWGQPMVGNENNKQEVNHGLGLM